MFTQLLQNVTAHPPLRFRSLMTGRAKRGTRFPARNLRNAKVVDSIRWRPGDPQQFLVSDEERKGLCLRVGKGGAKAWVLRYWKNGRARFFTFGRYPYVSCKEAGELWAKYRAIVDGGGDPHEERDKRKAEEVAELTVSDLFWRHFYPREAKKGRSHHKHRSYFKNYIEPAIGRKPAHRVTWEDADELAEKLRYDHYHTARLVINTLRRMYTWAAHPRSAVYQGSGPICDIPNPCRHTKFNALSDPESPPVEKFYLRDAEIGRLWHALGNGNEGLALKLQLLTGARIGEMAGLKVEELQLDSDPPYIEIPARRRKGGASRAVDWVIPTNDFMIDVLDKAKPYGGYVFPCVESQLKHVREDACGKHFGEACALVGIELPPQKSTHVLRATATTILARRGYGVELRNKILGRKEAGVDYRHYNAHDYFEEKRRALEDYGKYIRGLAVNAVN